MICKVPVKSWYVYWESKSTEKKFSFKEKKNVNFYQNLFLQSTIQVP